MVAIPTQCHFCLTFHRFRYWSLTVRSLCGRGVLLYGLDCHFHSDDMQVNVSIHLTMAQVGSFTLANCVAHLNR